MDLVPAAGLAAAFGYLCGSIPFAWLLVKAKTGKDIRESGSGNVGATNAARLLGKGWFLVVFLLDFVKGAFPLVFAAIVLCRRDDIPGSLWIRTAAGIGAILGHLFPFALGFRGGKGVATAAGVLLLLAPVALAAGAAAFLVTAGVSRFVSLGSVAAAVAAPAFFLWFHRHHRGDELLPVAILVCTLGTLILVRHLPNLRRIAAGTEPRLFARAAAAAAPGDRP